MCVPKQRFNARPEKGVKLGFITFNKFYQYSQDRTKTKTNSDFDKSPYYSAFVKFGNYMINTHCINTEQFMMWVIKSGIQVDKWAKDSTYDKFLKEFIYIEPMDTALLRTVSLSIEWAGQKQMLSHDMLRYGSESLLCQHILHGKISPWVLYNSQSGRDFLGRLRRDQMDMIDGMISPADWTEIFTKKNSDVEFAQQTLGDAGW